MYVRDAREADAPAIATVADVPAAAVRSLLHERTVRVAAVAGEDEDAIVAGPDGEPVELGGHAGRSDENAADRSSAHSGATDRDATEFLCGVVSFDAGADTVFVTQLHGSIEACRRLLEEPISFAESESMAVEAVVPVEHGTAIDALVETGFDEDGSGPRFDGRETRRFRLERPRTSRRNASDDA